MALIQKSLQKRYIFVEEDLLCFTAVVANSTILLNKWAYAPANNFETSTDWSNWTDYTPWTTITLSNIWDKLYMRNKSETPSNIKTANPNWYWYYFTIQWWVNASWDLSYMLCKNWTTELFDYCYSWIFASHSWLLTPPKLKATTLKQYCYYNMFASSWIKLSETQTGRYTEPFRIPYEWTGTTANSALDNMFAYTWWTFTWTPEINKTYYLYV